MASHATNPTLPVAPQTPVGPPVAPPAPQPAVAAPPNLQGASDARNELPTPARNKKEPRKFATPSTATVTGAPPLLLGVSNLPFATEQKLETNSFVPSALVLFALLAELDSNMANTYRFLQSAPNWIPLVSQAYIAVVWLIHIFRVAREANTITMEQFQLLVWFESIYDFRTMMIPGPLVPVFQSLAFTSGPFEWIGNIAPALRDDARAILKEAYSPSSNLQWNIPSIPLIIDQIQWFLDEFNITQNNEHFIAKNFYSNVFGTPAAANAFGTYAMYSPNARYTTSVSAQQYRAFKSQAGSYSFPTRLAATTANNYMLWVEFFRFKSRDTATNTYGWFSTMSATMQRYCQFVKNSVPMSAISLTGLGASTPIWSYLPNEILSGTIVLVEKKSFTDPTGNEIVQYEQHYASPTPENLSAIGYHFDPEDRKSVV